MRYVAAYMLASLGGKDSPSAADIEKILGSVGIDAESDKIKKVISELKGKALQEVIEAGSKKLATVPSGGGGGGAPAAGGGAASAAPAEAKEEKKEEKEESEESDDDMGFGLFD